MTKILEAQVLDETKKEINHFVLECLDKALRHLELGGISVEYGESVSEANSKLDFAMNLVEEQMEYIPKKSKITRLQIVRRLIRRECSKYNIKPSDYFFHY